MQDLSIRHIQKSRMASQGYTSSEHCSWWVGLQKRSIERGLAGRETQSLNIQQLGNRMQLNSFVCVSAHPCACICVWVCVCASACVHLCTENQMSGCV